METEKLPESRKQTWKEMNKSEIQFFYLSYINKYNINLFLLTETECDHGFKLTSVIIKTIPDIFLDQNALNITNLQYYICLITSL